VTHQSQCQGQNKHVELVFTALWPLLYYQHTCRYTLNRHELRISVRI